MDLLLQAAKVLELEQADVGSDRVSPRSTRGTFFQHLARSRGENGESSDGSLSYSENGLAGGEDDAPLAERRRAGGAGTREVHNQLEKNRRKQLRECFSQLQQVVPSLENKRVATQSILQGAIKHIKNLKKKDVEQEREIQMLAKRKSELKKKYDMEFNKCTEEQHRAAEVILQVIRSRSGSGSGAIHHERISSQLQEEDDGHTSDSTTTASEGPCNEGDFSDAEDRTSGPQPQLEDRDTGPSQQLVYPARLDRKRKLDSRSVSGEASEDKIHREEHFAGTTLQQTSRSLAAKSLHSSSSSSSISSVSSSSLALKHMLEQKKKNQVSAPGNSAAKQSLRDSLASGKPENMLSHLRPVAPAPAPASASKVVVQVPHAQQVKATLSSSKGPSKSASSLTSSYPMISNHLASSTYKPTGLAPSIFLHQDKTQPPTSPLVDIWTTSSIKSSLGTKAPDTRAGSTTPVKMTASGLTSPAQLAKADAPGPGSKPAVPGFTSPAVLPPIFTTTAKTLAPSIPATVSAATSSSNKPQVQQNLQMGLKTPEAKKVDSSFVLPPKTLPVLQGSDLQTAALLGKNIIGSNNSIASLQPMPVTSPLSSTEWAGSKVVPAIIPLTLASFLRGLPIQGGVGPLATFPSGPTIPISVASVRTPVTTTSWASVSPMSTPAKVSVEAQPLRLEPQLSSQNLLLAPNAPSSSKPDPLATAISLASTNVRIASLLAASGGVAAAVNGPANSMAHLSGGSNGNGQLVSSSVGTVTTAIASTATSTMPAAATVTLSLPDGLKPMALTPTLLPLTWAANVPLATSSVNQTVAAGPGSAGQLRLFAPFSQAGSLTNGQSVNGLVPTVVQLGSSGQMAFLQHHPQLAVQPSPTQHLLAQPIVVMATQASAGPLGGSGSGLAAASGASLNTTVSSSSVL
ncbi:max-binding protein mnt-like [Plakobranchus ocellatus]|uniref:Max-binding protein mnt-like n=1 Tax=Plakobranchus ocellatus TaxID=259542 RepID=A0AAV4D133_9GAST|nr:max-binding protein mnt-like [Plakobranchus ocellatus]